MFTVESELHNLWVVATLASVAKISLSIVLLFHLPHDVLQVSMFLFAERHKLVVGVKVVVEQIICHETSIAVVRRHESSQQRRHC